MEHAHNAALEQRAHVLNAVHIHTISTHVGLRMIHGLMRELRTIQPRIRLKLILRLLRPCAE
jgi:hypothetical protein